MKSSSCEYFHVTPDTMVSTYKFQDFVKVLDYTNLDEFLQVFWEKPLGFALEFDVICEALDCIEDGDNYFNYTVYETVTSSKVYKISASDIVCKERLYNLAVYVSNVINYSKINGISNDVLDFVFNDEKFQRVLKYMQTVIYATLYDGSCLTKDRIDKVRNKVKWYDRAHGIDFNAEFYVADRVVLFAALDALEKECLF